MKSRIAFATAAAALLFTGAAHAQADLAEKAGCNKCHAADTKKMGPSYKDIAQKYKATPDADLVKTRDRAGPPEIGRAGSRPDRDREVDQVNVIRTSATNKSRRKPAFCCLPHAWPLGQGVRWRGIAPPRRIFFFLPTLVPNEPNYGRRSAPSLCARTKNVAASGSPAAPADPPLCQGDGPPTRVSVKVVRARHHYFIFGEIGLERLGLRQLG